MSWINKQQIKRYWDFATLGNFKWYLSGIFFLVVASKVMDVWRFHSPLELGFVTQYSSWGAQYEFYNLLLHWNSIWVSSDLWQPLGIAFSVPLCLILLVAHFREPGVAYNWEGLLGKDGWVSPLLREE